MDVITELHHLPGSFGSKQLRVQLFIPKKTKRLVVFFHGCCGTAFDHKPTTYQVLADALSGQHQTAVVLFESSRKVSKLELDPTNLDFQLFTQQAFESKTFIDELTDAKTVVEFCRKQLKKRIKNEVPVVLVGFSLGGLMAIGTSSLISPDLIVCIGSATAFQVPSDLPILGRGLTISENEVIQKAAASYTMPIVMLRGSDDDTALKPEALALFESFSTASKKTYIEYRGVDHRFKQLNNQESTEPIKCILEVLLKNFPT